MWNIKWTKCGKRQFLEQMEVKRDNRLLPKHPNCFIPPFLASKLMLHRGVGAAALPVKTVSAVGATKDLGWRGSSLTASPMSPCHRRSHWRWIWCKFDIAQCTARNDRQKRNKHYLIWLEGGRTIWENCLDDNAHFLIIFYPPKVTSYPERKTESWGSWRVPSAVECTRFQSINKRGNILIPQGLK